jgi:hypothetical protein
MDKWFSVGLCKALDDQKGTKRIPRSTFLDYMGTLVGNELNGLRGEKYSTPSMLSVKIKTITSSCWMIVSKQR